MKMNRIFVVAIAIGLSSAMHATEFNQNFCDSTLRIDYILGGGPDGINLLIDSQTKQPGWAGRRSRLKEVPVAGNGTVLVTDPLSGDTLYMNTFSSLFQEWIYTPEAKEKNMSFENSFLVPLPKKEADITVSLRGNRHEEIGRITHRYRPDDELVALRGENPISHKYIHKGGDPTEAIDIAILAEGYTQDEMDSFISKAKIIADEILSYEPFASNKDKFNVVAVMTPSKDSGVTVPLKNQWKDTAFESHFSTFYSSRYLTTPRVWKLHKALEGIPYEHVLVLVNTPEYGGGGIYNCYQIATSDHNLTLPVAVHEFGHSFAGLADEYFYTEEESDTYPLDIEPWEQNITTMVDFDSKWKDLLTPGVKVPTPWTDKGGKREDKMKDAANETRGEVVVGVFEGGGYKSKGVFRPVETCRMRDNHNPAFCPVCERAISRVIEFYTK
ncbi:MAG: IgA Peptidase M64 [Muribaculaceae bacterium]|nr:IgA Peptidase M64 [Muribaculaceae bacterium]